MSKLFLLFTGVPLLELALLIKLGGLMGLWPTIGLVVATGVVGASLARLEGFRVLTIIQNELRAGRVPAGQVIDGLLILIGGILLLTPGFLTDLLGIMLLIPWNRNLIKRWLVQQLARRVQQGQARVVFHGPGTFPDEPPRF